MAAVLVIGLVLACLFYAAARGGLWIIAHPLVLLCIAAGLLTATCMSSGEAPSPPEETSVVGYQVREQHKANEREPRTSQTIGGALASVVIVTAEVASAFADGLAHGARDDDDEHNGTTDSPDPWERR